MDKEKEKQKPFDLPTELLLLENKRAEIKAQQDAILKKSEYLKNLQNQEKDILKPIQDKIKTGEASTDDKIKDFCLAYFPEEPEKEKQLYNLEAQLKEHSGEFILLKELHPEKPFKSLKSLRDRSVSFFEDYHWEERFSLGVINPKSPLTLDVEKGRIVISSPKEISFDRFTSEGLFLKDNPISLDVGEFWRLGKSIEELYNLDRLRKSALLFGSETLNLHLYQAARGKKEPGLEIIFGNKEVLELLNKKNLFTRVYPQIIKFLGKEIKSLTPQSEKTHGLL